MDEDYCFISVNDLTERVGSTHSALLNSPEPSSGYCSSEETRSHVKFDWGDPVQAQLIAESGPTWQFQGSSLGGLTGDSGLNSMEFDEGIGGNFDDMMIVDFSDQQFTFMNPSQHSFSTNRGIPNVLSDGNLKQTGLVRDAEIGINLAFDARRSVAGARASKTAAPVKSSAPSSGSQTVSSLHKPAAGVFDLFAGGDEDYEVVYNGKKMFADENSDLGSPGAMSPASQNSSAILSGVFNKGSHMAPSLSRISKPAAIATSCSTFLRHSSSMPNTRFAITQQKCHKDAAGSHVRNSQNSQATIASTGHRKSETKGGRSSNTINYNSALDDHKYFAIKQTESPPAKRVVRNSRSIQNSTNAAATIGSAVPAPDGKMSILEAFLRATCQFDPNKGSNAALAAEGMSHLCIEETNDDVDTSARNGNILKKLLLGQINQRDVHRCEERVIQERAIQERVIQERAIQERAIQKRVNEERAMQERAIQERAIQERVNEERAMQERVMQERAIQERAIQERAMQERVIQEHVIQEHADQNEGLLVDSPLTDGFGLDVDVSSLLDDEGNLNMGSVSSWHFNGEV